MIRINLLPVKATKKRGVGQKQLIVFLLVYVALIAVVFVMHQGKVNELNEVVGRRADIEKEIEKHKQYIQGLEKFKQQQAGLQQKLDVIKNLRNSKETPVTYLSELARLMPAKLWFGNLSNRGGRLVIDGFATDHQDIAMFMNDLEKSEMFTNVRLTSISRTEVDIPGMAKTPVLNFLISCSLTDKATHG